MNFEGCKGLNVAITGGAGFIGSHVAEKLISSGAQVSVIDTFLHGSKIDHLRSNKQLTIHEADIRDAQKMAKLLGDKDIVFHLAAVVGVEETQTSPWDVLDVEVGGTIAILNALIKNKRLTRFIFGSSSEVYGDSAVPMKEDSPMSPKSTYAVAKLIGEEYCKAYYHRFQLPYTVIRYFNVYGPRQDERFVISRFIRRALANDVITIYGDGKQTRDFTFVGDAVHLSLLAAVSNATRCQAINIGYGTTTSINDLAAVIIKYFGSAAVKQVHVNYDAKRPREIEVFSRTAEMSKTKSLLQYQPQIDLDTGIRKLQDFYKGK